MSIAVAQVARWGCQKLVTMQTNLERIRTVSRRIREDEAWVAQLREELRRIVIEAWEEGCTMEQIGEAAGLSRQRISKIIDHRKA